MQIELSQDKVYEELLKIKPVKATGSDMVSPKLLKLAGKSIVPSLTSIFHISAQTNSVPCTWKNAIVSAIYKRDDETERVKYRPISILSVPGKMMETRVTSTINNHLEIHDLSNDHQWGFKRGHSTELLLVKMTEDWRRALDQKLVVGIVFIDFKKAFDTISHPLLLQQLQNLGIAGDIWLWIKDYQFQRLSMEQSRAGVKSSMGFPRGLSLDPFSFLSFVMICQISLKMLMTKPKCMLTILPYMLLGKPQISLQIV